MQRKVHFDRLLMLSLLWAGHIASDFLELVASYKDNGMGNVCARILHISHIVIDWITCLGCFPYPKYCLQCVGG